MPGYILADRSVIQRLTKASKHSTAYQTMIGDRKLAMSFQTQAELLGFNPKGEQRKKRLRDLLAAIVKLPNTEATNIWYSRVIAVRTELRRSHRPGEGAQDGDVWVLSSALEHGIPVLSHDDHQVHLGRAAGLKVLTNLPGLRESNPSL